MQFTTNVQLLLDGLNTVTRALSARPTKQILEGVHLSAVGEHVKLTCSDGNLSIEMSILADVKEEGTAVLPGRLFTELSRKLPWRGSDHPRGRKSCGIDSLLILEVESGGHESDGLSRNGACGGGHDRPHSAG